MKCSDFTHEELENIVDEFNYVFHKLGMGDEEINSFWQETEVE